MVAHAQANLTTMARYYSDRMISGRLGNHVYCIRNGKTYVRAYVKRTRTSTLKQKFQQEKWRTTIKFLRQFTPILAVGYQNQYHKGLSEFTRAFQYHLGNAVVECAGSTPEVPAFEMDLQKVRLAQGNINRPFIITCTRHDNTISLSWEDSLGDSRNRFFDQMVLVAYIPGLKVLSNFNIGTREGGSGTFTLPDDYSGKAHVWVFFYCGHKNSKRTQDNISDSLYLGEI